MLLKEAGENWNTDYTKQVWSGPFKVTDRVKDNSMVLKKNKLTGMQKMYF